MLGGLCPWNTVTRDGRPPALSSVASFRATSLFRSVGRGRGGASKAHACKLGVQWQGIRARQQHLSGFRRRCMHPPRPTYNYKLKCYMEKSLSIYVASWFAFSVPCSSAYGARACHRLLSRTAIIRTIPTRLK